MQICGDHHEDPDTDKSYLKCHRCEKELKHEEKRFFLKDGIWVPRYKEKPYRGFGVSQMYSCSFKAHPSKFIKSYFLAQTNAADEQEFYNSKLGKPHIVEGARVTDAEIKSCLGEHTQYEAFSGELVTMGVDVGNWLHFEIDRWHIPKDIGVNINTYARCQVIKMGKCRDFEQLDMLMEAFNIRHAVIDAQPERRKAKEFVQRWYGHANICFYGSGVAGKDIHVNDEELSVTVDRTSWLDLSLGRFRTRSISLPRDTPNEYKDHLKAPVRIYEKDTSGNLIGRYVKGQNAQDHHAHSRTYAEIALPLAFSVGVAQDMESPA